MSNAIGVVGVDGKAPLYRPDDRWTLWSIHDIYRGQIGLNKFIPKVNDYVVEPETGTFYIVTALNHVTFIPDLALVTIQKSERVTDILIADTFNADNFRLYFDKSVTPYTISVDGLLKIYGSNASFARIYKGHFIDDTKILSRRYDNSNNFIGFDIPLSTVAFNTHQNFAIRSVNTANTIEDLLDGEVVTLVIFDSSSRVLSRRTLIVEETTFVAPAFNEQKYITQIFIKSPFISTSNANDILYPVNLPLASFNPIGVVQYNDGTQVEYPIDGDKFKLFGLDQFVSTIVGHRVPLVLSYRLDQNEAALATVNTTDAFITRPYNLVVSNPNTSYNVKLFIYPRWVDAVSGYTYEAYLLNLDRNVIFNVTNLVTLAHNSRPFNPIAYGVTQRLIFNLNLATVSPVFNAFLHVQTVDIILRSPANNTEALNIWEVFTQVPSLNEPFGTNLRASSSPVNRRRINIANNITTVPEFLNRVYYPTMPLINILTESEPLLPTHIELIAGSETILRTIDEFNNDFIFTNAIPLHSNVYVVFLRQHATGFFRLSVAGLTVR